MQGAIAAGHPLTAQVGADVLRAGGNAVDACVAAAFASWVTESPLTGPGGGGFMLVHSARDGRTRVVDSFVAQPSGRGGGELEEMEIGFRGESTQLFRIGPASVAVPGALAGLEEAHRRFGSLPWRELVAPAVELARDGVEITKAMAHLHAILDVILRWSPEGRQLYGRRAPLAAGERFRSRELADSLALIGEQGARALYRGDLGGELVRSLREQGGRVTERDLRDYRVVWRRPVEARFRGSVFRSNPPPASGGVLVCYGLKLLNRGELSLERLVDAQVEQARARAAPGFARLLYRGGLAKRVLGVGGTTHISVLDGAGNAVSLSISTGSGSGVVVPGTGFQLNNMLGEWDLVSHGAELRPGTRLTSMMAPSIALERGRVRLVLGSAGSARLRGAIMQVAVNALGRGLGVREAIERPRVHVEGDDVHCEGGTPVEEMDALEAAGWPVTRWRRLNLFFGGVAAVEPGAAAGDSRRGGHGIVIE